MQIDEFRYKAETHKHRSLHAYIHTYMNTYYKGTFKTTIMLLQQCNNYEKIFLYVYKFKNKIENKLLFINNHALGIVNSQLHNSPTSLQIYSNLLNLLNLLTYTYMYEYNKALGTYVVLVCEN